MCERFIVINKMFYLYMNFSIARRLWSSTKQVDRHSILSIARRFSAGETGLSPLAAARDHAGRSKGVAASPFPAMNGRANKMQDWPCPFK